MGGSTFAASFATSYGGKILSKRTALLLFIIFVFLGAVTLGKPVANTIGNELVPPNILRLDTVLIILLAATFGLFVSNLLHVPQSTSLVTVFSLLGVGFYYHSINTQPFYYLIPFWILAPLLGYTVTYFLGRLVYPPRKGNFWIYEKLVNHQKRLKVLVILTSCYNAFSIGTNNVANAVGPLLGADLITASGGFLLIAPVFGLGGLVFHRVLETTSEKIVPIGLFTAMLISVVCASLMITASVFGIPQSFVMIQIACIFAVGSLKDGPEVTFSNPITKKTYLTWAVTPVISFFIAFLLIAGKDMFFNNV